MQSQGLNLRILCHVQKDDEAEAQGINDCCHLVSFSVRHKVLQDHESSRMVLEKEENMSYRNLHSPLKFEGKD
jgi:hypothetical protein